MFSVEYRQQVSRCVLEWAESDRRVVAGARIGSLAHGPGDRWSDLDLTFAIADDAAIVHVLEDWTESWSGSSTLFASSICPAAVRSTVCSCFQDACSSTFPLLPRRISAPSVPSSNCSSGLPWRSLISRRPLPETCLATQCTMRYVPAFASNAIATVKPNTGLAPPAITV